VEYRVLLMHTGIDGIVPALHGLPSYEQFQPLRGLVDYVALGHIHKQYSRDTWLYNPGSTETWGAEESAWERGYYVVQVNTDTAVAEVGTPPHSAELVVNPRRPFLRYTFDVSGIDDPTALYEQFERFCRQRAREQRAELERAGMEPVIDVGLTGVLSFDSGAYERSRLEEMVREHFRPAPLTVRLHDGTRDTEFEWEDGEEGDGRDRSTWHQLEVHIFQELLSRDARYLAVAPAWARVLADLKQMALANDEPAAIARRLREARAQLSSPSA
jgi:hypothetical protein